MIVCHKMNSKFTPRRKLANPIKLHPMIESKVRFVEKYVVMRW